MKRLILFVALALLALPAGARAADEITRGVKDGKPYMEASQKITATAAVIAVAKETREVTMIEESGDTLVVECGPEVKNFAQIKVGDTLKVSYSERLTIYVEAPGAPSMTEETSGGTAKLGEKPAGSVTQRTEYKARIASIDKKNGTATLEGYDGEKFVVTPAIPENLDKVKVGELVVFTHTQSIALSVEKVKAPAKKKK